MECGFSVHQNRRRVPSARFTPNGNSFCRVASASRLMESSLRTSGVLRASALYM
jgi:hypothetical protein